MNAPAKANANHASARVATYKANASLFAGKAQLRGTANVPVSATAARTPFDSASSRVATGKAGTRGTADVPLSAAAQRATDDANAGSASTVVRSAAVSGDGDDVRLAPAGAPAAARLDDKFIETHHLVERYLERKLPPKGARDVENWCRCHPEYLDGLNLAERAQASLRLLEAAGRPVDFSEPRSPWWKSPYVLIACVMFALAGLVISWAFHGRNDLLRSELEDARTRLQQGSLEQPATHKEITVTPDRAPGLEKARIAVSRNAPLLIDMHIDMRYSRAAQYRLVVDKKDQGRALVVNNLLKDSNGELLLTFNTSGLAAGIYDARIDALPERGNASPVAAGWLMVEVH